MACLEKEEWLLTGVSLAGGASECLLTNLVPDGDWMDMELRPGETTRLEKSMEEAVLEEIEPVVERAPPPPPRFCSKA